MTCYLLITSKDAVWTDDEAIHFMFRSTPPTSPQGIAVSRTVRNGMDDLLIWIVQVKAISGMQKRKLLLRVFTHEVHGPVRVK